MKKYLILLLALVFTASMLFMGISCKYGTVPVVEEEEATEEAVEPEEVKEVEEAVEEEEVEKEEETVAEEAEPAEEEASETEEKSGTDHEVIIEDFAFDPPDLNIKVGDTVTWTQKDEAPHDVKMNAFKSETLYRGDTFSFTFIDAGTYEYICGIHPTMQGKIIVE